MLKEPGAQKTSPVGRGRPGTETWPTIMVRGEGGIGALLFETAPPPRLGPQPHHRTLRRMMMMVMMMMMMMMMAIKRNQAN